MVVEYGRELLILDVVPSRIGKIEEKATAVRFSEINWRSLRISSLLGPLFLDLLSKEE